MRVALRGAGEICHELLAQRGFHLVQDVFLDGFHAQHAVDAFQGEVFGKCAKDLRGVFCLDLGEDDRDRLWVFILEVSSQNRFVHVAQLVPHGTTGRAANFFHDHGHAVLGQELVKETLCRVVGAKDGTCRRDLGHEFNQQLLDQCRGDCSEVRHDLRDFLDLFVVKRLPDGRAVFVTEREHEHRCPFRS